MNSIASNQKEQMIKDRKYYRWILFGFLLLLGLWVSKTYSYLLFHCLAELFSIVVACSIFVLAWNSRQFTKNSYLLFIGIAYLFIGVLDMFHTLAYTGMGIFQGHNTNLSTQLWIGARYVESASLLIAPLLIGRRLKTNFVFLGYGIATAFLLGAIFYWHVFPVCFVEGVGLTAFKKVSEYIISFLLLASAVALFKKRDEFQYGILRLLIASIVVTIFSELAFTLYRDPYGLFIFIGHYLKIVSFYLIYNAIIVTGLRRPFDLLFKDLKRSEDTLRIAKDNLESEVNRRTAELLQTNKALSKENFERKKAEEALRESRKRLIKAEQVARMGFLDWDLKTNKIVWSREVYNLYDVDPGIPVTVERTVGPIHPDDREFVKESLDMAIKGIRDYNIDHRIVRPDGKVIWVHARADLERDKEGIPVSLLGTVVDITERKRIEDELNQSRSELLHSNRAGTMVELTAALAHELNHPLGSILNNANAAKRFLESKKPDLDEIRDIIADIISENRRANDVMQKLRALMKKAEPQYAVLAINDIIEEVAQLTHSELVIKNISLTKKLAEKLPRINGERIQLQQVLLNLIINATDTMKETREKKLHISTAQRDNENIIICVKDSGMGFDEKEKDNLFKPFFTTRKEGMGMGLSVSRTIIKGHGGEIWAENNKEAGASFFITLPIYKEKAS